MVDYSLRKRPKKYIDKRVILKDEDLRRRTRWAINYAAEFHELNNETMAAEIGAKIGTLANYRAMKTSPKVEFIKNFCGKYNFNEVWFLKCQGEPFPGARAKYPEVCGPEDPVMVRDMMAAYDPALARQKINIDEDWGKAYKVLSAGTTLSVALHMNIQQFAAALDTGQELKVCQDQIKNMQSQIDELKGKVDRLTAVPTTTADPAAGSDKEAM